MVELLQLAFKSSLRVCGRTLILETIIPPHASFARLLHGLLKECLQDALNVLERDRFMYC